MAALVLMPLFIGMDTAGAAVKPWITIFPNWTPIFSGESVSLTCNVDPTPQGNLEYSWYRNWQQIPGDKQSVAIQSASSSDQWYYQCRAGASERSEYFILEVMNYDHLLILQAPPTVHEGDFLSLRCHSRYGYRARDPVFSKDNNMIWSPVSESVLHIGRVNVTASDTYKCQKQMCYYCYTQFSPYTADRTISVSGHVLFSNPQVSVNQYPWIEGDHVTITCDTKLSPHRVTTELQFSFYRNGHNVQGFSSSNQYGVPSAQLEDSGNYTCQVQTPTGSVRKRSSVMTVEIQELFSSPQIKVSPDHVTEGDHMAITCDAKLSPHRETTELQFAFYRNGHNVQGFSLSNQYGVPSAQLENSGNYTCDVQTPTSSFKKRSKMEHIRIQELFSQIQITQFPDPVTQGENMTITCDTKLSSHRATTELQFAFYRNGHNVQGFSLYNQYGVPSAQLEDSGNYTCEVQTPAISVRKRSNVTHIHIQDRSGTFIILVAGVLLVVFLITAAVLVFIFRHKLVLLLFSQFHRPKKDSELNKPHNIMSQRGTNEEEAMPYQDPSELSMAGKSPPEASEVCYTEIRHTPKVSLIKHTQNDTLCVTYAVIQRDDKVNNHERQPNSELDNTSTIYQNFGTK